MSSRVKDVGLASRTPEAQKLYFAHYKGHRRHQLSSYTPKIDATEARCGSRADRSMTSVVARETARKPIGSHTTTSTRKIEESDVVVTSGQNSLRETTAVRWTSKTHLLGLNVVAICVHLVSGGLGLVVNDRVTQTQTLVAPTFAFVNGDSTRYLHSTPRDMFTFQIFWPLIAVEFITASFHVAYVANLLSHPLRDGTRSVNSLRWVEYSITASMMSAFGLAQLGATDFYLFLKLVTDGVALQFVGYCIELLDHTVDRDRRVFDVLWWVVGTNLNLVNVCILLYQMFASDLGANAHVFYENVVPFAVWFNTFGVVAQLAFRRCWQFADAYFVEKYYVILSLSTKVAVFWLAFGSYRRILESNGSIAPTGVDWDAVRYCAITIPAVFLGTYVLYDAHVWRTSVGGANNGALEVSLQGASSRL